MSRIKLIVGLANPGTQYAKTRHNAGAWYLKQLAQRYQVLLKRERRFLGQIATHYDTSHSIHLFIPETFMNLSGRAVAAVANFYHIQPSEILIAHDELDLSPGISKFKHGGSHGGHNGLKDIMHAFNQAMNFYRLRIGIGHPGIKEQVTDYVLARPSSHEQQLIDHSIEWALEGTELLLQQGITKAMQFLHSRVNKPVIK